MPHFLLNTQFSWGLLKLRLRLLNILQVRIFEKNILKSSKRTSVWSGQKFHSFLLYILVKNVIWSAQEKRMICFGQCWLSQFSFSKLRQPTGQRLSKVRTQQNFFSIGPILFLYYEESLVSSNLNSKLFRFHCVRPNNGAHTVSPFSDQKYYLGIINFKGQ